MADGDPILQGAPAKDEARAAEPAPPAPEQDDMPWPLRPMSDLFAAPEPQDPDATKP
jgi:hypothetical protein